MLEHRAGNTNRRGIPGDRKSDSRCRLGLEASLDGKALFDRPSERVQAEVDRGQSRRAAARRYDVSASFAVKLADLVLRTGSAEPAQQGRPPGSGKLAPHLMALLEWVEAEPDITMPELAAKLSAEKGVTAHPASLSRVLLKAGLSFKKNTAGLGDRARGRAAGA